ncbi:MAG TPA: hypothetical protein VFE72_03560 [Lysobacter sp.]|nr:hypothetical protein [Lysobacter sp.]
MRLQLSGNARDLALFNLAIDAKLRGCDLVALRLRDLCHGNAIAKRAIVHQKKTGRPVQFELTDLTRAAVTEWAHQGRLGLTLISKAAQRGRAPFNATVRAHRLRMGCCHRA